MTQKYKQFLIWVLIWKKFISSNQKKNKTKEDKQKKYIYREIYQNKDN